MNDNIFGDHWNGEDFSIFSTKESDRGIDFLSVSHSLKMARELSLQNVPSLRMTRSSLSPSCVTPREQFEINELYFDAGDENAQHVGGRVLDAVIRPFAAKISGIPQTTRFNYLTTDFFFSFTTQDSEIPPNVKQRTTEIFLPNYHYKKIHLLISVSDGEWKYIPEKESLYWHYDVTYRNGSKAYEKNLFFDEEGIEALIYFIFASFLLKLLEYFGIQRQYEAVPKEITYHWIHIRRERRL